MLTTLHSPIGFGLKTATINVYIENRPPLPEYEKLNLITPLSPHDISNIATQTGNHWRKIFNVYAKLLHELDSKKYKTWQALRDDYLLQSKSNESLLFSNVVLEETQSPHTKRASNRIHIIMGKTYAKKLGVDELCYWLSDHFAINESKKIIICPYFDYRQLSNIKITQLAQLIKQLQQPKK